MQYTNIAFVNIANFKTKHNLDLVAKNVFV